MTKANTQAPAHVEFFDHHGIAIAEGRHGLTLRHSDEDARDVLTKRTAQLSALLSTMYGSSPGEGFQNLSDATRENVTWLAADLATEVDALATYIVCRVPSKATGD